MASLLLILLPLWLTGKRDSPASTGTEPHRWRVPAYFIAIGLAFMFVEIAFIQKFLLFLSHPISFIMLADAYVGMGTALFVNPRAPLKVLKGLARWVDRQGCASVTELVGQVR